MNRFSLSVPIAAAALALVAGGCGGGSSEAEAASAEQIREDAMLAYARCMREHGIDMPDPQFDGDGQVRVLVRADRNTPRAKMDAAQKACEKHMEAARATISEEDRQRMQDQALKFARCMREHGIDMPDPDPSGRMTFRAGRRGFRDPGDDPKFREAEEACRSLMPGLARSG